MSGLTGVINNMLVHRVPALGSRYFLLQRQALTIIGLDLRSKKLKLRRPIWTLLMMISLITHNIPMLINLLLKQSDLIQLTDDLAIIWQSIFNVVKLTVMIGKRKRIGKLVQQLHTLNQHATAKQRSICARENLLDQRISTLYRNAAYGTTIASAVAPMVIALLQYANTGGFLPRTPMEFDFWQDTTRAVIYWPIYFWAVFCIASAVCIAVAADTLYSWLVHNIAAQFQLLEQRLEEAATKHNGASSRRTLVQCLQLHQETLHLVQDFNDIYAEILFVKFTLSYLQLCSLAYRFSHGGWSPQVPFRAGFLFVVLMQLGSYCYGGEYIKQQSTHLTTSVFSSFDWSRVPPQNRRLLLLMMLRAQRACKMKGYMFNVDLPLLLWVIKTAGSFLAMLKTLER